jgi:hypothetical protein
MFKSFLLVLAFSVFCFAQAPQQPTIEQIKAAYQVLKDDNVQVAARNNKAFTDLQQVVDYNVALQTALKATQDTVATLRKAGKK